MENTKKITYKLYDSLPEEARHIREEVFIKEQGFANEFDSTDSLAVHIVVFADGTAAGTGRLFPSARQGAYTIGRVAVLPEFRGLRLGSFITARLEEKAAELGAAETELSAQCRVRSFYEKNGYKAEGEVYLDEYCEHIHMVKQIKN